jgi:hypothetical protein
MRRGSRVVAMVAGAVVVTMPAPYDGASASCVGPVLELGGEAPPTVTPGRGLTVTGSYFVEGCNDNVGVVGGGCSAHEQQREPVSPLREVTLSIRQHGHSWRLGKADADPAPEHLGDVTWLVTLPMGLEPGRATLVTGRSGPLRVLVSR